jgi:hypothetical protein
MELVGFTCSIPSFIPGTDYIQSTARVDISCGIEHASAAPSKHAGRMLAASSVSDGASAAARALMLLCPPIIHAPYPTGCQALFTLNSGVATPLVSSSPRCRFRDSDRAHTWPGLTGHEVIRSPTRTISVLTLSRAVLMEGSLG